MKVSITKKICFTSGEEKHTHGWNGVFLRAEPSLYKISQVAAERSAPSLTRPIDFFNNNCSHLALPKKLLKSMPEEAVSVEDLTLWFEEDDEDSLEIIKEYGLEVLSFPREEEEEHRDRMGGEVWDRQVHSGQSFFNRQFEIVY